MNAGWKCVANNWPLPALHLSGQQRKGNLPSLSVLLPLSHWMWLVRQPWFLDEPSWGWQMALMVTEAQQPCAPPPSGQPAIEHSARFWDWFAYPFRSTERQPVMPELAWQHNGWNIQQHFSPSPWRAFTYQRAHTPIARHGPTLCTLNSVKGKRNKEDEKEALWTALICTREHTWLLHQLMLHSLNTSGGAYEQTGSIFLHPISPSRPILLAVDKCETQAWWQAWPGETDASAHADLLR